MKKIIQPLLLSLFFTSSLVGFAQQKTNLSANNHLEEQEAIVIKNTSDFYSALSNLYLDKERNVEKVTRYLHKDYSSTRYIIDVAGKISKSNFNLDAYRLQLSSQLEISGLSAKFKLEKVNMVRVYENFAVINYSLMTDAYIQNELVLKWRSFITNYVIKENGEWKIIESSGANIYKEQQVGICPCRIIKVKDDETIYTAKVLSPGGNNFNTDDFQFEFKTTDGDTKLIILGKSLYTWAGGKILCIKDGDGNATNVFVGNALTNFDAVNTILSKHLFSSKCLGFKTMTK
jgi:hypothetical protein